MPAPTTSIVRHPLLAAFMATTAALVAMPGRAAEAVVEIGRAHV